MIEYITERSKSTKIQKHICFCFLMSRRRWRVLDNCALESSKRCVFQGGIKMHDRTRLGYRHRISTSCSCSDGLIRKFLQWHHDSYGQVGTHNSFPQTSLPKLAQGHFSPLPEGSGQSRRGFRAALTCHLLLVCKPCVLVWLSRGSNEPGHQPFFLWRLVF